MVENEIKWQAKVRHSYQVLKQQNEGDCVATVIAMIEQRSLKGFLKWYSKTYSEAFPVDVGINDEKMVQIFSKLGYTSGSAENLGDAKNLIENGYHTVGVLRQHNSNYHAVVVRSLTVFTNNSWQVNVNDPQLGAVYYGTNNYNEIQSIIGLNFFKK